MAEPRIALVHDWLTGMRGGEKALLELCRLLPSAEIHTLLWNRGTVHPEIERRVRQTSFLQKLPRAATAYRNYLPLFPAAVRSLSIQDVDLVISSSHAVAKGVRVPPGIPHVSYIYTPMRYLWDDTGNYFRFGTGRHSKRLALALVAPYLRRFDLKTASSVDHFVAISENIRRRIQRVYRADATVIPPPVDTDFYRPADKPKQDDYYLVVSSLEPYKRVDLAIEAFRRLPRPLVVVGSGSQEKELRRFGGERVRWLGQVPDEGLRELYRNCRALVFPGIEDFGIVPVEAQACGKPVICCGRGGATETVVHGQTGLHFWPQHSDALVETVRRFERLSWDSQAMRHQSLRFSAVHFHDRMKKFLGSSLRLSFEPPLRANEPRRRVRSA